jgi:lipoate-protein ligase B
MIEVELVRLTGAPVTYAEGLRLQREYHARRRDGIGPDTLILLEHTPVITIGRGSRDESDLLTGREALGARGIDLVETDRGGEMTYHGPGQLVGYPILSLEERGRDLHQYLRDIEQSVIDTLAHFGIAGGRIAGLTGVWVHSAKICAIGIKVSRWITMHGFALNIDPDLTSFRQDIVPCGISDRGVTSLAELGVPATREEVEEAYIAAFSRVFDATVEER